MSDFQITPAHLTAMHAVRDGVSIFDRGIAQLLQEVERHNPEMVQIFTPREMQDDIGAEEQDLYDTDGRLCYLGAILTPKGREFLQRKTAAMTRQTMQTPDSPELIQSALQDDLDDPSLKP